MIAAYEYPFSQTKVFVFYGKSTGFSSVKMVWDSGVNKWNWNNLDLVAGDVNGDGKADAVAMYKYPSYETKALVFTGSSTGVNAPTVRWASGPGKWNWDNSKFVAADVNHDGRSDVIGFYRYAGNQTKAWLLNGQVSSLSSPRLGWDSGLGKWDWAGM